MTDLACTDSTEKLRQIPRIRLGGLLCVPVIALMSALFSLSAPPSAYAEVEGEASAAAGEMTEDSREEGKGVEEDPLAEAQARRAEQKEPPPDEPNELRLSASVRVRFTRNRNNSYWGDGGSRIGLSGRYRLRRENWLFGRAEAGFNFLDAVDQLFNPSGRSSERGENVFPRLLYAGVTTPKSLAVYGKNWSTWYQITGFTDKFESTGASASGTFNAGTDGGNTGTGRADGVLQARLLIDFLPLGFFKPFHLNLQVQHGEPVPRVTCVDYGTAFGASAVLQTVNDFTIGLAYNRADIQDLDNPRVKAAGIDGDAEAFAAGSRWFGERWYLGTVVSWLKNHETTGSGIYFDGWGWEVYGRYRLFGKFWGVGGGNWIEPDGGEKRAGDYRIRYGVLGLWYVHREFGQILYFEARIDDSRSAAGISPGNIYSAGIRWDLP